MNVLRAVLTGSLLMLPAIAAAQDVKIDFDKAFNFSPVKTYSIKIGTTWGNNLSQRRVLEEFDQAIAGKGWKKVDEAQADIVVILHGATQTKRNATTYYSGMGGYGYRGFGGGGMGTASTVVNEYTVGMLVVDMFDAKSKNLVFRGTAEDEISDNPEKNKKRLEKAVDEDVQGLPAAGKEVSVLRSVGHPMVPGGSRARRRQCVLHSVVPGLREARSRHALPEGSIEPDRLRQRESGRGAGTRGLRSHTRSVTGWPASAGSRSRRR